MRESFLDRLYIVIMYGLAIAFALFILVPVYFSFVISFSNQAEVAQRGFFLFPEHFTLGAYKYLFANKLFDSSLWVTGVITIGGTFISLALTTLMAYGLSKTWLVGNRALSLMVVFTMLFNGGIIPLYMVVKSVGLLNSLWALMLPAAITPFYVIVMRSFFGNIPKELEESATIDGCSDLKQLIYITIPLSIPAMATFGLFYAVHIYNTFFQAIMFITDQNKWPIQVLLRQMLIVDTKDLVDSSDADFVYGIPVKMAAIVISALPMLLIYPFLQRYFTQGMMVGAVKG